MGLRLNVVPLLLQGTVLRYISVHTMLHIVMWTYAIRLGLYALLPYAHSPWYVCCTFGDLRRQLALWPGGPTARVMLPESYEWKAQCVVMQPEAGPPGALAVVLSYERAHLVPVYGDVR